MPPIGPSNAYMCFANTVRASIVEYNPGLKNTEILSLMDKLWKDISEFNRAKFVALAEANKEAKKAIYKAEMAESLARCSITTPALAMAVDKLVASNHLHRVWFLLTVDEREPYVTAAKADNDRHKAELEEYKAVMKMPAWWWWKDEDEDEEEFENMGWE